MTRTLVAGVAGALMIVAGSQVFAADLPPAPAPPPRAPATYVPVAPPVYNWGSVCVGINGGGAFGTGNWTDANNGLGTTTGDFDTNGWLIGGTLGVNFQASQMVFGIEGDIDYSTIKGTVTPSNGFCANVNAAGVTSASCQTANNWLAPCAAALAWPRTAS